MIPSIFTFEQFVCMSNVSKTSNEKFKWCKDLRYINQKFINNYDEDSAEKGYTVSKNKSIQKNYKMNTVIYKSYLKKLKLINRQNLHVIVMIKQDMWSTLNYYNKL